MNNITRLKILKSNVARSDMHYKSEFIAALDEGITSLERDNIVEIFKAMLVGFGLGLGLSIIGYLTIG